MTLLATYLHNIDPFIVQFPQGWPLGGLRWYGTSYVLGFVLCGLFMRRVAKVGNNSIHPQSVWNVITTIAFGVVIGGRLGYVVFYDPALFGMIDQFPYWGALAVNRGGMASHGGIIGAIVATLYLSRRGLLEPIDPAELPKQSKKKRKGKHHEPIKQSDEDFQRVKYNWGHLLDLAALGTPLGLCFGRVANFINGELFGRAADPSLPWAVKFPQEAERWLNTLNRPGKLNELHTKLKSLSNAVGLYGQEKLNAWNAAIIEWDLQLRQWVDGGNSTPAPSAPQEVYMTIGELVAGTQQGDTHSAALIEALRPALTARHPSQLYQGLLEGLLLFAILIIVYLRPRKPGVLSGVFVTVYGVLRIVAEFWREPDAHLGFQWLGLTRGQWISTIMLIGGPALIIFCARRKAEALGGLLPVDAATSDMTKSKQTDKAKEQDNNNE